MKKTIILITLISCFNIQIFAGNCSQTGGRENCVSPTPPRITSDWAYGGYGSPQYGNTTLEKTVQDFFKYQEKTNNWDLSSVSTYSVKNENPTRFMQKPFDDIPTDIEFQLKGPFIHKHAVTHETWLGEWSGIFGKKRESESWKCPISSYVTDQDYTKFPPFYCRKNSPPRTSQCPVVGNPCSVTTGNKFQRETDWQSNIGDFKFYRTFNSLPSRTENTPIWTHNFNSRLIINMPSPDDGNSLNYFDYIKRATTPDVRFQSGYLISEDGTETEINIETSTTGEKVWRIGQNKKIQLAELPDKSWQVTYTDKKTEIYNEYGALKSVQYQDGRTFQLSYVNNLLDKVKDRFGQELKFHYNPQNLISSVTLPNNKKIIYQYDAQNRLIGVTRPGYGTKTYHYSENSTVAPSGNPNLLTGITDEVGKRYANYAYDDQDRGILTEHAGGAQKYTLQHTDRSTNVTDPNGTAWRYNKILASGTPRISSSTRANVTQSQNSYDQAGNITQKIEKGLTTNYTYDLSRNLETSRTEAVGTAQERKIETTWHTDFPKPTEIKESSGGQVLRLTTFSYDNNGNALSKTMTDPQTQEARTWSYEYNNFGQLSKETNPQGQISIYQYDETNGNLLKTVSADGITTTYSQHNADGQPQHIESSNGQSIDLVYDDAGRIIQQKQTVQQGSLSSNGHSLNWWQVLVNNVYEAFGADAPYTADNQAPEVTESVATQTAITSYEYDLRGLLIATTLPDGERIEYTYDDAHRLIEIKDQSGNRTVYSLNANGDITQTEVYGTTGQLEAKNQQVYDSLGRLQQSVGNNQQRQSTSYNNDDQVQSDKNALNQSYGYSYDVLGRQISETDPLSGINKTEYDSFDQIKKVIDAKNGTTTYQYNAFGEKTAQSSPDTGMTAYQYQNGVLKEKTDALQLKHQYEYDAQGRVILQKDQKTDGSDGYEHTQFAYGQSGSDLGQLTLAKNKRAEIQLNYNSLGLVSKKSVKYLTTHQATEPQLKLNYSYTLGGKLKQLALPSGNVVNYDYNATGQLTGIRLNDQSFIGNIQYNANGVKGWTYSAVGDSVQYVYDLDGRIKQIQMPNVFDKNYSFDSADRILTINDSYQSLLNNSFKHDALSRLIEQNNSNKTLKYSYDKNSNRLSRQTVQGTTTNTENYSIATDSNRLSNIQQGTVNKAYSYLATGQITSDGTRNYSYDAQGRSETISQASGSILNGYDAFGQRIIKFTEGSAQSLFIYDEDGQLLGEYSPNGKVIREYIWLNGTLVGLRSYQYPNEILRVHTDHLGTPRAISNNSNQVLWRWEGDQFGDVLPTGNLSFPIRHAGQYYDAEVGIFYNYFRDYDPITGRYIESDPIGLNGGLNTYGYVGGNALHAVDPRGQFAILIPFLPEIGLMLNTIGIAILSQLPDVSNPPKEEKCEREDNCGPYTRVQAYAIAQAMAQISRKERYHRPVTDSSLNRTSQGKCYNGLKSAGATHLGYGCEWQNSWIEDHPDGHSHLPGETHHDCPHLHVYKNGISVGTVQYKRG